uniref:Groucho/TLE N-terminal Q-rich domain-containing protein n=1 Tax=Marmota marmota marmota TaxID=9994 RepID=A0A8C5ZRL6_MARMA
RGAEGRESTPPGRGRVGGSEGGPTSALWKLAHVGLKLECEKLASEKTEMQRHYVMYYEMSYGLNIEMHKQAEIVKRLSGICAQIIPFLTQEHQQQVLQAVERAKQVTVGELNSLIGVTGCRLWMCSAVWVILSPRPAWSAGGPPACPPLRRANRDLGLAGL